MIVLFVAAALCVTATVLLPVVVPLIYAPPVDGSSLGTRLGSQVWGSQVWGSQGLGGRVGWSA